MADYMQSLSEDRFNRCQIFGWFGFLQTESEPKFGFPHIPSSYQCSQLPGKIISEMTCCMLVDMTAHTFSQNVDTDVLYITSLCVL